jgi:sugar diacid utilization regulator
MTPGPAPRPRAGLAVGLDSPIGRSAEPDPARLDALVARTVRATFRSRTAGQDVPGNRFDPERQVVEEALRAVLEGLDDAGSAVRTMPGSLHASVAEAVRQWVRLPDLLQGLWLAYSALTEHLLVDLADVADTRGEATFTRDVMSRITARMKQVHDWIADCYVAEDQRGEDARSRARHQWVMRLLDAGTADEVAARRLPGVDLGKYHVAVVLWSDAGSGVPVQRLVDLAHTISGQVNGGSPLVIPAGRGEVAEVWAWLHWQVPPEPGQLRALGTRLTPPAGVYASTGPVCRGVDGFRRSHELARAAQRLVRAGAMPSRGNGSWLCDHSDLAVLSVLTSDVEQARRFTDAALGALNAADARCAVLRETLRLYLSHDRSRETVARLMFVSRNTVAYRVSKATELLGRPFAEDPLNIRLALEVAKLLDSGLDYAEE